MDFLLCRLFAHRLSSNFVYFVMLLLMSHYQFSLSRFAFCVHNPSTSTTLMSGGGEMSDTTLVWRVGAFSDW